VKEGEMNKINSHMDLIVWQKGIKLVEDIYRLTSLFPKEEIYGLTSQIKRAIISVPSNIAEGASRQTTKEFIQFLYIALGSLSEVETQLIIAEKLCFIKYTDDLASQIKNLKKMLTNLIISLKDK
jgi:four helix bundle protein